MWRLGLVPLLLLALAAAGCGHGAPARSLLQRHLSVDGRDYAYGVDVPPGPIAGLPLIVVLHGCQTTAEQQAAVSGYHALADRDRFLVLYPEVDGADVEAARCWRAVWSPQGEGRGRGDAAAIAAMTKTVIRRFAADRRRVYLIGISAGGFETSILGAAYPDLYTAIAVHSGVAYMDATCPTTGDQPETVAALAGAALDAMGPRARVMPVLVIHGDRDDRVAYACGLEAVAQWVETDDGILQRTHRRPLPALPTITPAAVPDGHSYTTALYADAAGCPVVDLVSVDGMGHFWSGGTTDPRLARYSDPRGPSAAAISWAFFSRWSRAGGCRSTESGR